MLPLHGRRLCIVYVHLAHGAVTTVANTRTRIIRRNKFFIAKIILNLWHINELHIWSHFSTCSCADRKHFQFCFIEFGHKSWMDFCVRSVPMAWLPLRRYNGISLWIRCTLFCCCCWENAHFNNKWRMAWTPKNIEQVNKASEKKNIEIIHSETPVD